MYRLIKTDGTELGVTESVIYIKINSNGCFVETSKSDAVGVAFNSIPYNLIGHDEISNADTVVISKIDTGTLVRKLQDENDEIRKKLAECDKKIEEIQKALAVQVSG